MNPEVFAGCAVPSGLKPSPLICECVAVRFSLELPLTSVIWTPVGGAVGGAMIARMVELELKEGDGSSLGSVGVLAHGTLFRDALESFT
jgi:hypothetical protein